MDCLKTLSPNLKNELSITRSIILKTSSFVKLSFFLLWNHLAVLLVIWMYLLCPPLKALSTISLSFSFRSSRGILVYKVEKSKVLMFLAFRLELINLMSSRTWALLRTDWTSHIAAWSQLKTIGHLFYATSSFVHHFVAIGEFKLQLQSGNTQFGSNSTIFIELCDLEIWGMTLKNNTPPLLCYFKLCASFLSHWWNLTDDLQKQ